MYACAFSISVAIYPARLTAHAHMLFVAPLGVSLKTQELYLLVHLTRLAADIGFYGINLPMATYYGHYG